MNERQTDGRFGRVDPDMRFWAKVDRSGGPDACWPWRGCKRRGKGDFWNGTRTMPAHRFSYELAYGPSGSTIAVCPTLKLCVNPAHLRARGNAFARWWGEQTWGRECVTRDASVNDHGYSGTWHDGQSWRAHRLSYVLLHGSIPAELDIDHLCRVRNCVNPFHLEAVTHQENTLRGDTIPAANALKTHCPEGHPYDDTNTLTSKTGGRLCRTCRAAYNRRYKQRQKERAHVGT